MNKKFRFVWLILITGTLLSLGRWPSVSAANITVTSLADGAANTANCPATTNTTCRLRDAMAKAAAGDTITFTVNGTITLNSGELVVSKNLTISGPGANLLTVSGNQLYRVFRIASGFNVAISGLTIANGNTTNGGGIHNSGSLTLTNIALTGNVATLNGGGIYHLGPALNITGSTLSGNSTTVDGSGGGIYNYSTATVSNSTLSGNSAKLGGGIYFQLGSLTLTNCTLAGNSATSNGGGLYKYSSDPVNLKNTIIAQNTGGAGPDISGLAVNSQGYNLIGNTSGATIGGVTTGNILNQNPLLAPLGNYGGPTQTRPLLPGSPAINAGTATSAPPTDQRNILRVGDVDIGAFESRGFTFTVASGNNQSAELNKTFAAPLAVTVTASGAGEPVSGGRVTFTPPVSGASAGLAGTPATINGSTATTGTVTANATVGTYNVVASATGALSVNFTLTNICIPPSISVHPAPQSVCPGSTATFKVTATGTGLTYQWRKNFVNIVGATSSSYTTPATTFADYGTVYDVWITGACGTTQKSTAAELTIGPQILVPFPPQNPDQIVSLGSTATFSVAAIGAGLTYQWRKNGVNIVGATSSSYTTPATTGADNSSFYSVLVTGACGVPAISPPFRLVVLGGTSQIAGGNAIVMNSLDKGAGSLRAAIDSGYNNINFAPGVTHIYLNSPIIITHRVSIEGPVTISGAGRTRIFELIGSVEIGLFSIEGVTFVNGYAGDGRGGGAILNKVSNNQLRINDCTFSGNRADGSNASPLGYGILPDGTRVTGDGGAISNFGNMDIFSCSFYGNSASGNGGAIFNNGSISVAISTFSGNLATGDGGGIANSHFINDLDRSTLSGNFSVNGGGIAYFRYSSSYYPFRNCTISGNSAAVNGGGIYTLDPSLGFLNSTVFGNQAVSGGGGMYVSGGSGIYDTVLKNTIIAGNTVQSGNQGPDILGTIASYGYNLIGNTAGCSIQGNTTGNILNVNPVLAPLGNYNGNYGAPTQTHALLPGSPAINAGDSCVVNNSCLDGHGLYSAGSDQRNHPRMSFGAVDIGAFESQGFLLAIKSGDGQSAAINKGFANPLAVSVTAFWPGEPVSGGKITFTVGPSATIAGNPATINASGVATTGTVTANATVGTYSVLANAKGVSNGVNFNGVSFSLTNTAPLQATQASTLLTTSAPDLDRDNNRKTKVVGDYDGDGKSDLAVWQGDLGEWQILYSSTGETHATQLGDSSSANNDLPVTGDFDGDGKTDVAVFRRNGTEAGHWFILQSSDGEVTDVFFGSGSDIPVAADYDGDGKTDIAVWRGAESTWHILRSSDHQNQTVVWGTSKAPYRDVPVPADYDGDGKTDIAVFRQQNGHWYIRQSSDGAVIDRAWGWSSDVPVASDYDGDGKADIAVWRGAEGAWYVLRSSDGLMDTMSCGASSLGDVPVSGDYDGDGKADVAFWRASEGVWYVKSSADASTFTKTQGRSGDKPINARPQ